MGIYFGCHCFNLTNGHASSCVAQFIYADVIRPLKWNIHWTTCQKCKVGLTGPLLPPSYSCGLGQFKADCKLGILLVQGNRYPILGRELPSSPLDFCRIDWKGGKTRISGVGHVEKRHFPKVASLKIKTFTLWKMLSPICGLQIGNEQCSVSKILGNNLQMDSV